MEFILDFICGHAEHAHWILFFLLLLAGLNIPISEDLILLGGGAIASTCIPEHTFRLYLWIFLGCYLSAWEAYWIGRLLGPRLYTIRPFKYIVTIKRLNSLRTYYAKYGALTFVVGRFIPGGIRNALFMSCGLTKMPFNLFIMRDGVACLLSTSLIFLIGFHFAEHIDQLLYYVKHYSEIFAFSIGGLLLAGLVYFWYSHHLEKKI